VAGTATRGAVVQLIVAGACLVTGTGARASAWPLPSRVSRVTEVSKKSKKNK